MSEVSLPASSSDTGTHPPPLPAAESRLSLLDFPPAATLRILRKPLTGMDPVDGGQVHISELIPGDGDHVLVVFATMATDDWNALTTELSIGDQLGLKPLLVGAMDRTHIGCGLWGVNFLAGNHGLTSEPQHPTVFTPSPTLMKILGIDRGVRTRNALVLIRNGHVIATWVSGGDGDRPHDWTTILALIN